MSIGDIGALIDSLEWDSFEGNMPSFCHVSGDVYAVAYYGVDGDGFVCTFSIDASGNIGASIIDSWEFDTSNGAYPEICKVYGTIYAIAYTDINTYGQLITFSIANDGTITKSVIDDIRYSAGLSTAYQLYKIASNVLRSSSMMKIQTVGSKRLGSATPELSQVAISTSMNLMKPRVKRATWSMSLVTCTLLHTMDLVTMAGYTLYLSTAQGP